MTAKFFIIGAGGFAREIYAYLEETDFTLNGVQLAGFLDDNPHALDGFNLKHRLEGALLNNDLPLGSKLIMAVANPSLKEMIFNFYKQLGFDFLTYKHQTAFIGNNVVLGEGTIVAPQSVVTADVTVGKCVTINALSSIGHDASIGNFSTLSGHCDVTGFVQLGEKVFMGSHALIIPNVKIGDMAVIGAGSVVISKVKPGVTMFGNPAKKIK
ncbi:acetyltransferase [Vibrio vulnificus]|uniref:acetyltransferase n=1 Tax=Vibrio vulnificus TaxID=672 RepID=UPI003ED8E099